jgi:hypothetical protein
MPWIVPIPGYHKLHRLKENLGAVAIELSAQDRTDIAPCIPRNDELLDNHAVSPHLHQPSELPVVVLPLRAWRDSLDRVPVLRNPARFGAKEVVESH